MNPMQTASFPRRSARTQGFTLGAPRNVTVVRDGEFVLFLRSSTGRDRANGLWALDATTGTEHLLADPAQLDPAEEVSATEQARRERARERASGITGYATDHSGDLVAFALSGRLFTVEVATGAVRELPARGPVADPRPNPSGGHVAYLSGRSLRLIDVDGTHDHALAQPDSDSVTWGAAEFIAAEEMSRYRGYWWAPDGSTVLATRVDESAVDRFHLGDPAEPTQQPAALRYPAAGASNADVSLILLNRTGTGTPVDWNRTQLPYLVAVHWSAHGAPLIAVQSRDQRTQLVLTIDPDTGHTRELHRETNPHWVEIKPGWPSWTADGQLVRIGVDDDAYRLFVGDQPWTSAPLQVRSILDVGSDVLLSASNGEPTEVHLYRADADGVERLTGPAGVHGGARGGDVLVVASSTPDEPATRFQVFRGGSWVTDIANHAEDPQIRPNVELRTASPRDLRTALLLPEGHRQQDGPLPVLLDPYGGPQAQRVLARQQGYLTSQWFADQGFAVLITDGRGMTGRGPSWDRAVAGDLAEPPLQDQVDALHAVAAERPELDLGRVGIRGWSFGGYLAALAVLRRPDVFHTGIAGAPVCDWRLYDTHYTERYLGDPASRPDVYRANSVLDDAAELRRPLLLIHGTVDDNVFPAHTLRLSAELTAAGRPHTVLPLPGVSHMPTDEATTENLLLLQVDYLRNNLPS